MVHSGTSNTMNSRSTPAIALGESNDMTDFLLVSLDTGKRLHCNKWVECSLPDSTIREVEALAQKKRPTKARNNETEPNFTLFKPMVPNNPEGEYESDEEKESEGNHQ